jgi:hypothetical protein
MTAYAKGNKAVGLCQRCGEKKKLHELRPDGQTNLLVCGDCYDIKHPAEYPVRTDDAVALHRPAPDLDAEASREIPAQFDEPLVDSFGWPSGTYFGGGT